MVEKRKFLSRAQDLAITIEKHTEALFRERGGDIKEAFQTACSGKINASDPDYDEIRKLVGSKLKARGLIAASPTSQ